MEPTPLPAPAPQKFVSPETWALARRDYLAGETAAVVARRYGIGIDNFRKRQINEGWTRKAQREAKGAGPWPEEAGVLAEARAELERATAQPAVGGQAASDAAPTWRPGRPRLDLGLPYHPGRALCRAVDEASRLVAEGRGAEAQAVIKAAEMLSRLTGYKPNPPSTACEDESAREVAALDLFTAQLGEVRGLAMAVVEAVLRPHAPPLDIAPWHRAFVFRARSITFGEARARADFEAGRRQPWAGDVWNADGTLRPVEEADIATTERHRDELAELMDLWGHEARASARANPKPLDGWG